MSKSILTLVITTAFAIVLLGGFLNQGITAEPTALTAVSSNTGLKYNVDNSKDIKEYLLTNKSYDEFNYDLDGYGTVNVLDLIYFKSNAFSSILPIETTGFGTTASYINVSPFTATVSNGDESIIPYKLFISGSFYENGNWIMYDGEGAFGYSFSRIKDNFPEIDYTDNMSMNKPIDGELFVNYLYDATTYATIEYDGTTPLPEGTYFIELLSSQDNKGAYARSYWYYKLNVKSESILKFS
ncbi:MAG: hypothetical protein GX286_06145 [Clostridiales bacterium]|nr:hypothetical protein [Clostridiales bacterium]